MSKKKNSEKLALWQERLRAADAANGAELEKMDERERLYNGSNELRALVPGDTRRSGGRKKTSHVRNIIFENIESQVSTTIPKPKVTARRKQDEHLAEKIEHFLRNELDRLPFERLNDMAERTVPIQGGAFFLVEWDNGVQTHMTVGEEAVELLHPKQIAPQPGIYTGIEDMDWLILKIPTTREMVRRRYGVTVPAGETEPEVRSVEGTQTGEDAVTQYIGFAKNDTGGIDRYTWVNDVELEDLVNYQARRQSVCAKCGSPKSGTEERCPACGGEEFTTQEQEYEQVMLPMVTGSGLEIPGQHPETDEQGQATLVPTLVPYYRPDRFPVVLQRSVSVYGKLLGSSDVDGIRDQQNTVNRMEQKIIDRLVKAGTRITLPDNAKLRMDPEDGERWYLGSPADKSMIGVYDFSGNLQYELVYLSNVYEEARQILGITDSFQGRRDATATSGKAKEFSAAQAAGRLESKRMMKNAAYAELFELMFRFWLAYADEPRSVTYKDSRGETQYEELSRYDFLEQDENGEYWWNDQFLFSCDTSAALAANREAMWQETRMNLQTGAFGDPTSTETLILFWSKMEELHYPGASTTKKYLEERIEREEERRNGLRGGLDQSEGEGRAIRPGHQPESEGRGPSAQAVAELDSSLGGVPPELAQAIEEQAKADALKAMGGG